MGPPALRPSEQICSDPRANGSMADLWRTERSDRRRQHKDFPAESIRRHVMRDIILEVSDLMCADRLTDLGLRIRHYARHIPHRVASSRAASPMRPRLRRHLRWSFPLGLDLGSLIGEARRLSVKVAAVMRRTRAMLRSCVVPVRIAALTRIASPGSGRQIDSRNTSANTIQAPYWWINSFMTERQSGP